MRLLLQVILFESFVSLFNFQNLIHELFMNFCLVENGDDQEEEYDSAQEMEVEVNKVVKKNKKGANATKKAQNGTKKAQNGTKKAENGTKKAENGTKNNSKNGKKRKQSNGEKEKSSKKSKADLIVFQ